MAEATQFLTCVPGSGGQAIAPCVDPGTVPSIQTGILVDAATYNRLEMASAPLDPATMSQLFLISFGTAVSGWLLSYGVGLIMRTIRDA